MREPLVGCVLIITRDRRMKNTELTRRARGAASFEIIAVIYGGKRRSWLKRERVFKMRKTIAV